MQEYLCTGQDAHWPSIASISASGLHEMPRIAERVTSGASVPFASRTHILDQLLAS